MSGYNVVTLTSTGQILRAGFSDFENDGSFDGGTETFHADITNRLLIGILIKYLKVIGSVITLMSGAEQAAVDAVPEPISEDFHTLIYPGGAVETISANGALSLNSYASVIDASSLDLTLADGTIPYQTKRVQTQTGSCTVVCSLDSPNVSFTLSNNEKAELMWHPHPSANIWRVIDSKGIVFNT